MDFLKNISASLSKAAEATTKKASELTDTAKLKIKQNRITSDINDTYNKIGALIYKQYKESGDESAAIAELCLAIDKSNEELNAVNAERLLQRHRPKKLPQKKPSKNPRKKLPLVSAAAAVQNSPQVLCSAASAVRSRNNSPSFV